MHLHVISSQQFGEVAEGRGMVWVKASVNLGAKKGGKGVAVDSSEWPYQRNNRT